MGGWDSRFNQFWAQGSGIEAYKGSREDAGVTSRDYREDTVSRFHIQACDIASHG